ncbi:hypothetical protein FHX58_004769 [Paraburkholderia tropica]|nr:hypothetical protein [Paraburkholderia tropica]
MKRTKLTGWIVIGMLLGIAVGYGCHRAIDDAQSLKSVADGFALVTDLFLRLIKMIVAPLVFATLVVGVAKMGDAKAVGRVGVRTLAWFLGATFVSLLLGALVANWLQPGAGLNLPLPDSHAPPAFRRARFRSASSSRIWCPRAWCRPWPKTKFCRSWCLRRSSASASSRSASRRRASSNCSNRFRRSCSR